MNWLVKSIRWAKRLRSRMLGRAAIKDIPTDRFNALRAQLASEGWRQTYEYSGFDAWIDYGCVKLSKGRDKLKLEWDNWSEGSVEGRRSIVRTLANRIQLPTR